MITNKHILVIDDEPDIRQLLSITLSRMGLSAHCAENLTQGYEFLKHQTFALCLTDLKLPDGSGIDFVKTLQQDYPELAVIVITAHGSMDVAIKAMKHGAFDFINKPVDLSHLRSLITDALSTHHTTQTPTAIHEIIGESAAITALKEKIVQVSRSQAPVFIVGESGSGKELVARSIHAYSSRKDQAFIAVNCGAIPQELMESELFGHIKGSFTGAHQDKQGLFQAADGGTLLLDEIADLPLSMQVKLLRAIQEKTIRPIGSQTEIPVNVRILSATHKDLSSAINSNLFRSDLFYRINVIDISVPPLRERYDDIALLGQFILKNIAIRNNTPKRSLSDDAIQRLKSYDFPGNIRELENILERACALTESSTITPDNLKLTNRLQTSTTALSNSETSKAIGTPQSKKHLNDFNANIQSIDEYLDNIEKDILLNALEKNRWNRTATAKILGITFRSLRYRLKKLGIEIDA